MVWRNDINVVSTIKGLTEIEGSIRYSEVMLTPIKFKKDNDVFIKNAE
jgi:hypothetical protein